MITVVNLQARQNFCPVCEIILTPSRMVHPQAGWCIRLVKQGIVYKYLVSWMIPQARCTIRLVGS